MSDLESVFENIANAEKRAGRKSGHVKVVAVSKGQSVKRIQSFLDAKVKYWALGESYANEMLSKQNEFQNLNLRWHFLGRLQSRKIPEVCRHSDVLHAVSRIKELEILFEDFPKQQFYLQINVSGEASKAGFIPVELEKMMTDAGAEAEYFLSPPCLGLMCMPSSLESVGEEKLRREFSELRNLRDRFLKGKELNMGTSGDYEIAIEEGADVIRLGSCLFGSRKY